jgi:5'-nucleotidase
MTPSEPHLAHRPERVGEHQRRADLAAAVAEQLLSNEGIPLGREIYVNRTLRMDSIRYVGFDLDWTLASYDHDVLGELTYRLAAERLVASGRYPEALAGLSYRPEFSRRGLLLDRHLGTVIKMDRHRYVGAAYLGYQRLNSAERAALYRQEPIDLSRERFYRVDTLFELPEVALFNDLVELVREGSSVPPPDVVAGIFDDVRRTVDLLHADGSLKTRIGREPEGFLARDRQLGAALARLLLGGKRLFLLTNSEWSFTKAVCSYLFDDLLPGMPTWRDYFDLVVVSAAKPGFFRDQRPFVRLGEGGEPVGEEAVPEWNGLYSGGSRAQLMRLLDAHGERVLFVGDHVYGDIRWPRVSTTWRTALVVSELETEIERNVASQDVERDLIRLRHRLADMGRRLGDLEDLEEALALLAPEDAPRDLRTEEASRAEELRRRHREISLAVHDAETSLAIRANPTWRSLLKHRQVRSLWAEQMDDYACIYTSRVANFAYYDANRYFRVLYEPLKHELDLVSGETPDTARP